MKAFITGITGFIGSHLAEHLIHNGDQVLGVGKSGRWRSAAPSMLQKAAKLHGWNIESAASPELAEQLNRFAPDAVFHFAGISIPAKCGTEKPTQAAIDVNVHGTKHVLDLVGQLAKPTKFIFASTVHVYDRVTGEDPIVAETDNLKPISAYGETKLTCEEKIQQRVETEGLNACIARGFHHIGPRQPDGLMLTDWLNQLEDPNAVEIQVRSTNSYLDLIDVRDAAAAYRLLAEKNAAKGVYNLGSGQISNSGDVLETILSFYDRKINVVTASNEERWNAIANIDKLRALGWTPNTGYEQTISDMISSNDRLHRG